VIAREKHEATCLQESPTKKAAWLTSAGQRIPPGTRVRVVASDVPAYVGATGTVVDYDLGDDGSWPLVGVRFDAPIGGAARDGFYCDGASDDEIVEVLP